MTLDVVLALGPDTVSAQLTRTHRGHTRQLDNLADEALAFYNGENTFAPVLSRGPSPLRKMASPEPNELHKMTAQAPTTEPYLRVLPALRFEDSLLASSCRQSGVLEQSRSPSCSLHLSHPQHKANGDPDNSPEGVMTLDLASRAARQSTGSAFGWGGARPEPKPQARFEARGRTPRMATSPSGPPPAPKLRPQSLSVADLLFHMPPPLALPPAKIPRTCPAFSLQISSR